ncbi:hypothetical protein CALVIDRAFT_199308 [Calocera viscosa TUFC12733]|uniref:Uncharacterized protein n=1 Tax=Calocera viscosa (strain TUFC12733) TaxID=1330018 RepID=A0A167KK28_CALVF|nr:hypothetical protein CALVIDRAFT_199308 [Calocera viscosa TUFC12733]
MTQSQSLVEEEVQQDACKPPAIEVLYLTATGSPIPSIDALQQQAVVLLSEEGWTYVKLTKLPKLRRAGKSFIYALPAPVFSVSRRKRRDAIPGWGDLSELPTSDPPLFESSDFLSTLCMSPNMWTLIPSPHFLPSPHHIPQLPPACPAEFALSGKVSPYARSTVYIPITGKPPYDGASSAMISKSWPAPRRVDGGAYARGQQDMIIWTTRSVHRLWHFVIKIQEKGNCGPVGIAYQPSYVAATPLSESSEAPKRRTKGYASSGPDCACIKVYCPTVLRDYLLHALRNFPASKEEGRRQPLLDARFASVEDDGSVRIG